MEHNPTKHILAWFQDAKPHPSEADRLIQLGCHFEEVAEMMATLDAPSDFIQIQSDMATTFKTAGTMPPHRKDQLLALVRGADKAALLDDLCDQIVTAIGVAHMFGMDILGALAEVARSNDSKRLPDGTFLLDENGKIKKGPNYTPPNLKPFVARGA